MATVLPQSNESFLPWLQLIMGSIEATKDRNRENQDTAALSEYVKSNFQGDMPMLRSNRFQGLMDAWIGQKMQMGGVNKDIGALNDMQQKREGLMPAGMFGIPTSPQNVQASQEAMTIPAMGTLKGAELAFGMVDPYRKAQMGGIEAQAMRDRAEALAALNPQPKTYQPEIWRNTKTGETVEWQYGTSPPQGTDWELLGRGGNTINIDNKPAPSEMLQGLVSGKMVENAAQRLQKNYKPEYVGPWQEFTAPVRKVLPKKYGGMSPGEAEFRTDLSSLIRALYAQAGKQVSDREISKNMASFPQGQYSADIFPTVLDKFIERVKENAALSTEVLQQSGYRVPNLNSPTVPSPGTSSPAGSAAGVSVIRLQAPDGKTGSMSIDAFMEKAQKGELTGYKRIP